MSESGRKRSSKWDLKELSQSPFESGNLPVSIYDKRSDRQSPRVSGSNGTKRSWSSSDNNATLKHYSGPPLRESLSGGRFSLNCAPVNRDSKEVNAWIEDDNYSMSPGLDVWRKQSPSRSPKRRHSRSPSRSRSRSPRRDFGRELGFNEGYRSRAGLSSQSCKDFAVGKCRKGSNCQFLHHDNQNFEDRRYWEGRSKDGYESRHRKEGAPRYMNISDTTGHPMKADRSTECCTDFLKGKCRRGASCRYAHPHASDGRDEVAADEIMKDRGDERKNRGPSFDHVGEREPRRSGDIPCKFFAAGNCRNGKNCRFSHFTRGYASSDGRSREDRWGRDPNVDGANQSREVSKWSHTTLSEGAMLSEEKNRKAAASEPQFSALSKDDETDQNADNRNERLGLASFNKSVESGTKESFHAKTEKIESSMGVTESRSTDSWLGDMEMSPEWNYRVLSPTKVTKEEPGYITQSLQPLTRKEISLPISNNNLTQVTSSQMQLAAAVMQPNMFEKLYLQQDKRSNDDASTAFSYNGGNAIGNTSNAQIDLNFSIGNLPAQTFHQNGPNRRIAASLNAVGQTQPAFNPDFPSGGSSINPQKVAMFQDGISTNKLDIGDANTSQVTTDIPPMQNPVSREQLAQLTNLSASLAQLLGNGQQLPQLFAALNPPKTVDLVPTLPSSAVPVVPDAATSNQPRATIMSQKQYDPISDGIEQTKHDVINQPPGFSPNEGVQESIADGKQEMTPKYLSPISTPVGPTGGSFYRIGTSEEDSNHDNDKLKLPEQAAKFEAKGNDEMGPEESKKQEEKTRKPRENSPVENIDGEGKADEGKKNKDVKGIRAFKFALVEFIKELLKPTWKEGQINKEAYKTIVKKVSDKVTSSIQGAHIPQTQEKIDHYLSFSKPKLTKLVQAYVEKHQKNSGKTSEEKT